MRKKIMELKEKKKVFCVNCRHLLYQIHSWYDSVAVCEAMKYPDPVTGELVRKICHEVNKDCNCPMFERKKP
jgi:hypothetical protein